MNKLFSYIKRHKKESINYHFSVAKEIINYIVANGTVRSRIDHVLERKFGRHVSNKEIALALAKGRVSAAEREYSDWRYRLRTGLGGGLTLVIRIDNNMSLTVITVIEEFGREYRRKKFRR